MKNKRKNERINCAVPVDGKEGSLFSGLKTLDFSKGGLGFISEHEIPLNKEIVIEIDLSNNTEPVLAIGKVKWVEPISDSKNFRIGMSFEDVIGGSKSRLNKYFSSKK